MMLKSFLSTNSTTAISIFYVNQKKKMKRQKKMSQFMTDHKAKINNKPKAKRKEHKKNNKPKAKGKERKKRRLSNQKTTLHL